jgi:hypothetical protein
MENPPVAFAGWPAGLVDEGGGVSPELQKMLDLGLIGENALPAPLRTQKAAKAFQQAFELIGGVPRLALWADQNPSKFYPLFSKMIPQTVEAEVNHNVKWNVPWLTSRNLVTYQPVEDAKVLSNVPAND